MSLNTQEARARNLFLHCGESDSLDRRGRFWRLQGLSGEEAAVSNRLTAADVGPDAVQEIQKADHERIVVTARERRRRQLEERAAAIAAQQASQRVPTSLPAEVQERLDRDEERRRSLLETHYYTQWLQLVEMGRAAQIPIALGERRLGAAVAATIETKRATATGNKKRNRSASPTQLKQH